MLELTCDGSRVLVDPGSGGRLASLRVAGRELLVARTADPLQWGCYPMAPWAGRLRRGSFEFAGRAISLPINLGAHAIHGTTWNRPWDVVDEHTLETDLGEHWPFSGRARQEFCLADDALRLRLSVHADDQPFPASLGWHPWFRRDVGSGDEARLSFEPGQMYCVDAEQIPTGEFCVPPAGPWDDCFTGLRADPVIRWPGFLALQLQSTLDHWVVYDRPEHALCVEPMSGPPNALNLAPGLVTPDSPLAGEFTLRWSRD